MRGPIGGRSVLGTLLATLRTEQGWTLLDAARESQISHRVIAKLEKGGLDTSLANLEQYLRLYSFTIFAKRADEEPAATNPSSPLLDENGLPKW